MTPSERLKEIEDQWPTQSNDTKVLAQLSWLIARVRRLTEALEFYASEIQNPHWASGEKARKALESDEKA